MSDYIYQELNHSARVSALKKLSRTKEQRTYTKSLDDKQVAAKEKEYSQVAMRIQQLEDDLKEYTAKVKGNIKELKTTQLESLEEIATRKRQVYDWVYGLPDQVNGKMLFYDESGELIDRRDLFDNEMQKVLFIGEDSQTATDSQEHTAAKSVLDQFEEAEIVNDGEGEAPPEYEPEIDEEAPDESDLEEAVAEYEAKDHDVFEDTDEVTEDHTMAVDPEDTEDWRQRETPEESTDPEKKKRSPRKKKDPPVTDQ